MSLPICAKGPVSGARNPILIGADCAGAPTGAASDVASASRTTEATRRMRVMSGPPCDLAARGPERAQHAARCEQDDADVHGAQDEQPALGVHADEVLEEHDHGRAEGRPRQGAGAAEGDHEERLHGGARSGRGTPAMPLSPLVSETQRKARPQTTMPSASVIIRK